MSAPPAAAVGELAARVLDEIGRAVVGKREVLELVLCALLADGHVLFEDNPGVAKTLIARSFAACLELRFARLQFTPDLMPADITGSTVLERDRGRFEFRPGPVFAGLVLGDEINRAPPKTQAALLEAMQERQVTVDGVTHPLPRPFFVLATQNPIEHEGTYPLPEAQLDRFLVRTRVGYLDRGLEWELLARRLARGQDEVELSPVAGMAELVGMQAAVETVAVEESVGRYVVDLVAATRESPSLEVGASPRGSLALLKLARARAAVRGRDYVTPDDVKSLAGPALAHRVVLRPEAWARQVRTEDVIGRVLGEVPAPSAEEALPKRAGAVSDG